MPSTLLTHRHQETLVLTLSDPATRNTLSAQACTAGIEALDVAESDSEVRCVILRGEGEHFCAGTNVEHVQRSHALGADDWRAAQQQLIESFHGLIQALRAFPKPVLAAVEGTAEGAGFSLALACDLVVAAEDATFVMTHGQPVPWLDGAGIWRLARAVPRQFLQQMLWLPEPLNTRQLHALGLINWVTGKGQALAHAIQQSQRLARLAPEALASAKESVEQAPMR